MKSNKTLKIVLISILAVLLCLAIFFLAAPRTAFKLIMSDTKYAEYVVSKNLLRAYSKTDALKLEGRLSGTLGEIEFLNDEESAAVVNKYIKNVLVSGELYKGKEAAKLSVALSDRDGVLLSSDAIISEDLNCFRINEINSRWFKLDKEKTKATTAAKTSNSGAPGIEIEKLIKVTKNQIELNVTTNQLKSGIASDFLPEEYRLLFENAIKSVASKLSSSGFETIKMVFGVDSRNRIEDIDVLLEGNDKKITFQFVFGKENEGKLTYNDLIFNFVTEETELKSFDIPSKMEVLALDEDSLKNDLIEYLFGDAMESHSDLKEVYSVVFGSKVKSGIGALLEGIVDTEDLSSGIQGIIDSAMNGDPSGVKDIVTDFFKAFGLYDE